MGMGVLRVSLVWSLRLGIYLLGVHHHDIDHPCVVVDKKLGMKKQLDCV